MNKCGCKAINILLVWEVESVRLVTDDTRPNEEMETSDVFYLSKISLEYNRNLFLR